MRGEIQRLLEQEERRYRSELQGTIGLILHDEGDGFWKHVFQYIIQQISANSSTASGGHSATNAVSQIRRETAISVALSLQMRLGTSERDAWIQCGLKMREQDQQAM